jgi:hypothetical protein
MAHSWDNFLILTVFKINFKINPWKTLFAPADSLCRATCSGAAGVPRWLAAARGAGGAAKQIPFGPSPPIPYLLREKCRD